MHCSSVNLFRKLCFENSPDPLTIDPISKNFIHTFQFCAVIKVSSSSSSIHNCLHKSSRASQKSFFKSAFSRFMCKLRVHIVTNLITPSCINLAVQVMRATKNGNMISLHRKPLPSNIPIIAVFANCTSNCRTLRHWCNSAGSRETRWTSRRD